jgi:hypothetical protein
VMSCGSHVPIGLDRIHNWPSVLAER